MFYHVKYLKLSILVPKTLEEVEKKILKGSTIPDNILTWSTKVNSCSHFQEKTAFKICGIHRKIQGPELKGRYEGRINGSTTHANINRVWGVFFLFFGVRRKVLARDNVNGFGVFFLFFGFVILSSNSWFWKFWWTRKPKGGVSLETCWEEEIFFFTKECIEKRKRWRIGRERGNS